MYFRWGKPLEPVISPNGRHCQSTISELDIKCEVVYAQIRLSVRQDRVTERRFHSKLYLSAYGSYLLLPIGNTFGMPLYKIPKENIYNTLVVFVCEIFSEYTFYLQLQTISFD